MTVLFLFSALVILCGVSYGFSRSISPIWTAVKSAVSGIAALLLVNMTSVYTGCYIAINPRTVFVSTVLSLPGVFSLLVMKLLLHY